MDFDNVDFMSSTIGLLTHFVYSCEMFIDDLSDISDSFCNTPVSENDCEHTEEKKDISDSQVSIQYSVKFVRT